VNTVIKLLVSQQTRNLLTTQSDHQLLNSCLLYGLIFNLHRSNNISAGVMSFISVATLFFEASSAHLRVLRRWAGSCNGMDRAL
jgi:hypothetical protein